MVLHIILTQTTNYLSIKETDPVNYFPPDDPNVTNLKGAYYDCERLHNLRRQFIILNENKILKEPPLRIQDAKVQARVYERAEAKCVRGF